MIPNILKKLFLTIIASLAWTNAFAACYTSSLEPEKTITLPSSISIYSAPIGSVIASSTYSLWGVNTTYSCSTDTYLNIAMDNGQELSGYPKVYKTNIKGVGIRAGLWVGGKLHYAPDTMLGEIWGTYAAPRSVVIDLIRIDAGVSSGTLSTNFKVTFSGSSLSFTVKSTGSSTVVNNVMFSSCAAVDSMVNVQMGKEAVANIKAGRVAVKPFNFDVRCTGLKPTTAVPVKVYFDGDSSADGMLELSNAGKPGVASGIGIALADDKGVKLPFDKTRSIRIEHNRSHEEGEIYRFSGTARYVPTKGEAKPGRADATMTYVIDYN